MTGEPTTGELPTGARGPGEPIEVSAYPVVALEDGPPAPGLSAGEAAARAAAGRANVDTERQRTDGDVVRANALTFFNVVLGALILALLATGGFRDGLFVGGVVAANVAAATLQELLATRRLRELRALTAPFATVVRDGVGRSIPAEAVVEGDLLHLASGDQVVADGRVLARVAEVDESLLTGESEPVRRGPGEELRSGSFCVAGDCYYTAQQVGIDAYVVRLTADARELVRRASPLTYRFARLLRVLLIATARRAAALFIQFTVQDRGFGESLRATTATVTTVVPVGLLLGLTVVTSVGALRVSRSGAIVQDIHAVEALNYVDVVALDKTGTLTTNRLHVTEITWSPSLVVAGGAGSEAERWAPWLGAFARATARESRTAAALDEALEARGGPARVTESVPFSSARRWSAAALEWEGGASDEQRRVIVMGAPETLLAAASDRDDATGLLRGYRLATADGLRGVVLAEAEALPDPDAPLPPLRPLALVTIADELRHEVRGAFELMEQLRIAPKVISGDHPETVSALLAQLGVPLPGGAVSGEEIEALDDEELGRVADSASVFGRITPRQKERLVRALVERGHFVAMVGDGANDVRALRAADVAVAMASGTATARAVAGIVLLEDSFAALIRGTQEATFVLGNAARLSKLFLTKSVYAYLLILVTNLLGLDFPFLPRQGSVMSLLTLGIPALFISIGVPPRDAGRDFTRAVLRFALPAGVALAASAIVVQFLVEGLLGRDIEEARTLVSVTIVVVGVAYVVEVLGLEGSDWRSPLRPLLTIGLAAAMLGALLLVVNVGWLRDFFAFTEVPAASWIVVLVASVAALVGQYMLSRHWQKLLDLLTAKPPEHQRPRGRSE
jgi:cation-transporting ATPase E